MKQVRKQIITGRSIQIKLFGFVIIFLLMQTTASSQHTMHPMPVQENKTSIALIDNIAGFHHPVSTTNREAQRYFDQGLAFVYAYNGEDALRSFQRASELDPQLAMAWWGMALTKSGSGVKERIFAYEQIQKALSLPAPVKERKYIEAMAKRVSADTLADWSRLNQDYVNAMANLMQLYPDDPDAAVLYAFGIVFLKENPKNAFAERWNERGDLTPECEKGVAAINAVLEKFPNHIGANHLYIHAVEGSKQFRQALISANRIRDMKEKLDLRMGHLWHMPAHIYLLTGEYEAAAKADEFVFEKIDTSLEENLRYFIYGHSIGFLHYTYSMMGRYRDLQSALDRSFQLYNPHPSAEDLKTQERTRKGSVIMLVRFKKWEEILNRKKPEARPFEFYNLERLWALGMAYANTGKLLQADTILHELYVCRDSLLPKLAGNIYNTRKYSNLAVMYVNTIKAKIAEANKDHKAADHLLRQATIAEDALPFSEPPFWYSPVREMLGGVLFRNHQFAEAEKIFREELKKRPNNPRALFGLHKSLEAVKNKKEAKHIKNEFKKQWKYADTKLKMEEL